MLASFCSYLVIRTFLTELIWWPSNDQFFKCPWSHCLTMWFFFTSKALSSLGFCDTHPRFNLLPVCLLLCLSDSLHCYFPEFCLNFHFLSLSKSFLAFSLVARLLPPPHAHHSWLDYSSSGLGHNLFFFWLMTLPFAWSSSPDNPGSSVILSKPDV